MGRRNNCCAAPELARESGRGGLLLASATVVSIFVAVLLALAPPKLPTRQGNVVEVTPARRKLDQP
jgi:hypothetical protein